MIHLQNYKWVAKACSKDETRRNLLTPWVADGWMIASDGHRSHMLKTDKPDGILDCDFEYIKPCAYVPNILLMLPTVDSWTLVKLSALDKVDRPDLQAVEALRIGNMDVNASYVCDAFGDDEEMLMGSQRGRQNPLELLYLTSMRGDRQVLLMPIRPFNEKEWDEEMEIMERRAQNTYKQSSIICPYCGYGGFLDEECALCNYDCVKIKCPHCAECFECVSSILSVVYTTQKSKDNSQAITGGTNGLTTI